MNLRLPRSLVILAVIVFLYLIGAAVKVIAQPAAPFALHTTVSIVGEQWHLNGRPTYAGRGWQGKKIEGLLMNSRMVQGVFDDLNPATVARWAYPDTGKWDAERNTREFLAAMPTWRAHGLLAFTLCLQGGSPEGYSQEQPWHNSAFAADGSLRPDYAARAERIIRFADDLGMVVILAYFYYKQDHRLADEAAVLRATDTATRWVLDHGWRNVVIEVCNETNEQFHHAIIRPVRVHELIERVRTTAAPDGRRLLVSASYTGGKLPSEKVLRASDFVLLHGNKVHDPARIAAMVRETRALPGYRAMPILFNEDDHFNFEVPVNNFTTAVGEYAGWGYFDFRMTGEAPYHDGYQSIPANWSIRAPRKAAFFRLLAEITGTNAATPPAWTAVDTTGKPHARHEAAFIALGEKIYLLGGRRIQPADIFDPAARTWTHGAPPPVEVHHFQPVVWENKIWLVGAMTGLYPRERALDHIPIYDPAADAWSRGPSLPEDRRRGGAGAVIHEGKLYVVCGIINGHWDGHVAWLDVCDLKTGAWRRLPDAPRARDHFQATIIGGKLYAVGGRRSSAATNEVFTLLEPATDVFDLKTATWSTLPAATGNIPTPRAGTMNLALGPLLLVAGGETNRPDPAHDEVEALDTRTGRWTLWSRFARGRHGSGIARVGDALYIAAGSGSRGGKPELDSTETFPLAAAAR